MNWTGSTVIHRCNNRKKDGGVGGGGGGRTNNAICNIMLMGMGHAVFFSSRSMRISKAVNIHHLAWAVPYPNPLFPIRSTCTYSSWGLSPILCVQGDSAPVLFPSSLSFNIKMFMVHNMLAKPAKRYNSLPCDNWEPFLQ